MKIEDLIQILNNRLREFNLSKEYAVMSGDLERVNAADKEIITLEDTLYQLNLLVDASKSAVVKETTLAEVITDGSVAVLGEYDITPYATDPEHEEKILEILSAMGVMDTAEKIETYIKGKYESSPVTGEMIMSAALAYAVDARLMMALMELDSRFGTVGVATSTLNPGNVGNDDGGNTRTYDSWQEGVTAVAEWLSRHRVTGDTETPPEESGEDAAVIETQEESETATSTPSTVATPETPESTATTTPETIPTSSGTSTPETVTNQTTEAATTTEQQATTTPETTSNGTSTPETITNQTTETATTTEQQATTTPETTSNGTSTPSIIVTTSTTITSGTSTPDVVTNQTTETATTTQRATATISN